MDSKRLKVKMTVSVQLQRAIKDTRRWIRVLSSETIGHLNKCICFINTKARLFCDARPRLHVIRNNVEKVTLDVGSISSSHPSSKSSDIVVLPLNSLICNSLFFLQTAFDLVFARSTCKHWLGTSAYVKRDLFNVVTYYVKSGTHIAEQASFCV